MKKITFAALIILAAVCANAQTMEETFEAGKKCFYSDDFDGANRYFMEILNSQDDGYRTHYYKGLIYEIYFDNEKALNELSLAISKKKTFGDAYFRRAVILEKTGDTSGAISDYTKAIKNGANSSDAYFNRASLYQALGENDKAIKDYSGAIKMNPADDIAYYNRGMLHMSLQYKDEAISDFESAIQLDKAWEKELRELINMLKK